MPGESSGTPSGSVSSRASSFAARFPSDPGEQLRYDEARTRAPTAQGYRVLRFWSDDVSGNLEGVPETISDALHE